MRASCAQSSIERARATIIGLRMDKHRRRIQHQRSRSKPAVGAQHFYSTSLVCSFYTDFYCRFCCTVTVSLWKLDRVKKRYPYHQAKVQLSLLKIQLSSLKELCVFSHTEQPFFSRKANSATFQPIASDIVSVPQLKPEGNNKLTKCRRCTERTKI